MNDCQIKEYAEDLLSRAILLSMEYGEKKYNFLQNADEMWDNIKDGMKME